MTSSVVERTVHGYKGGQRIPVPADTKNLPFEIQLEGYLPAALLLEDFNPQNNPSFVLLIKLACVFAEVRFTQEVYEDTTGMFLGLEDKTGSFSKTRFQMRLVPNKPTGFDADITKDGEYCIAHIVDLAANCLNKLVEAYCFAWARESVSANKDVEHFYSKDWYPVINRQNMSPLTNIAIYSFSGNKLFKQAHVDYRSTGCGLGMRLSEHNLVWLQNACMGDVVKDSAYYKRLANRYYSSSEFEAFVLMVATYIDKFIFERARAYLKLTGLSVDEIEGKMHSEGGNKKRKKHSISREEALKLIFKSKNFQNSAVWKNFRHSVIEVRDDIVHGSILTIDKGAAKTALDSSNNIINFLGEEVQRASEFI